MNESDRFIEREQSTIFWDKVGKCLEHMTSSSVGMGGMMQVGVKGRTTPTQFSQQKSLKCLSVG